MTVEVPAAVLASAFPVDGEHAIPQEQRCIADHEQLVRIYEYENLGNNSQPDTIEHTHRRHFDTVSISTIFIPRNS